MAESQTRNVVISGRRTSIRLETPFWSALEEIIEREGIALNVFMTRIDAVRHPELNLTSAIRVFVQSYLAAIARSHGLLVSPETE
jgi:predicted DNA-binding ribbon-helix-helix protein